MSDKKIQEGLADLAKKAEHDHEVQMARADLYKIAKYAIKLHDMLRTVSEREGIKGWQQSKITKASDYISSVYHNLDYAMKFGEQVAEGNITHKNISKNYNTHAGMNEDTYKQDLAKKLAEKTDDKKTNAFQRGFNSVQKGNKFGPDFAQNFIKGMFTGGGDDSKDEPEADANTDKTKPAPKQPAAKAEPAVKGKPAPKQPAPKKEIPFPKSKEGVQLKPGDKVTYTNQQGKQQNAAVNKMLKTKDKHGDLQIQLKMGSVTFAIDRDNISAANGKPWTFDPATSRGTAK